MTDQPPCRECGFTGTGDHPYPCGNLGAIGIINSDMIGTPCEHAEHVDWDSHDEMPEADLIYLTGQDAADYAASNPHMIVWEATA